MLVGEAFAHAFDGWRFAFGLDFGKRVVAGLGAQLRLDVFGFVARGFDFPTPLAGWSNREPPLAAGLGPVIEDESLCTGRCDTNAETPLLSASYLMRLRPSGGGKSLIIASVSFAGAYRSTSSFSAISAPRRVRTMSVRKTAFSVLTAARVDVICQRNVLVIL